jgi:hypothetical protein
MHAEDDRYGNFFLFTEREVDILCKAHNRVRCSFAYLLFVYNLSLVEY